MPLMTLFPPFPPLFLFSCLFSLPVPSLLQRRNERQMDPVFWAMGDTPNSSLNSGGAAHGTIWFGRGKGRRRSGDCIFRVSCVFGGSKWMVHGWGDVATRDGTRRDDLGRDESRRHGTMFASCVIRVVPLVGWRQWACWMRQQYPARDGWAGFQLGRAGTGLGIWEYRYTHTCTCNGWAGWPVFSFLMDYFFSCFSVVGYPRLTDLDERCWFLDTRLFNTRTNAYLPTYLPTYLSTYLLASIAYVLSVSGVCPVFVSGFSGMG